MKRCATVRFFVWIVGLVVFCLALNLAADGLFDAHSRRLLDALGLEHQAAEGLVVLVCNLVAMPFVLLAAWWVARLAMAPLRRIAKAAEEIRAGQLKRRIPCDREDDEWGRLAGLLNDAFDEYDRNLDRQRKFAANAAHQLRTPLAVMRGAGEICLAHAKDAADYRRTVEDMLERLQGLTRLCEQLLELSRVGMPALRSQFVAHDPASSLRTLCDDYATVASARGIRLRADIAPGARIRCIPELFAESVANLLDNAVRHAPDDGEVALEWQVRDGAAGLCVEDNGPGIPAHLRESAFEPLAQGRPPGMKQGTGLGLAIVAEIARLHDARAAVGTGALGGARICLTWPLDPAAAERSLSAPARLSRSGRMARRSLRICQAIPDSSVRCGS